MSDAFKSIAAAITIVALMLFVSINFIILCAINYLVIWASTNPHNGSYALSGEMIGITIFLDIIVVFVQIKSGFVKYIAKKYLIK